MNEYDVGFHTRGRLARHFSSEMSGCLASQYGITSQALEHSLATSGCAVQDF